PAPEPQPAPQPAPKLAPSAPAPEIQELSGDVQANRRALLRTAADFAEWGRSQAPSDPLFWQAGILACWGGIGQLPPNEAGATMVPEPDPFPTEAVLARVQAGDIAGSARLAMESLAAVPLALDLAYLASMSLAKLGAAYAPCALALEGAVISLLHRLPGLERLQFNSGRPFADAKTREWIASFGQGAGQRRDAAQPARDAAVAEAESLASKGGLARALDLLDEAMAKAPDMEAKCALRIAQARLLAQADQWNAAQALAEEFCQTFAEGSPLADWHPRLACDALKTAARIWEGAGGEKGLARAAQTLRRLAALRPSQALRGL
ncbi:MAG: type VI secretion system domain-containing protein, partial [Desulfovibrio sp.]|nr:type VI secretion system domain-containing protein [Desulfovibrio sp.]